MEVYLRKWKIKRNIGNGSRVEVVRGADRMEMYERKVTGNELWKMEFLQILSYWNLYTMFCYLFRIRWNRTYLKHQVVFYVGQQEHLHTSCLGVSCHYNKDDIDGDMNRCFVP